jgi:hypothetical protein
MAGSAEVLQEYLIKLGYKVDEPSLKKFNNGLEGVGKRIFGIGTAVAGAVIAVETAAAAFAYSMRKVYFESKLADSSVKNLQAMEFAGKKFGISAETMGQAIHSMAQAFRLNPGLQGLVESFGIRVSGRDVSDVMKDYVKALDKMPEFQGAQYAGLFGIDPDTYHLMRGHIDELNAEAEKLKATFKDLGLDMDDTAVTGKKYADSLDDIKMHFDALEKTILSKSLPAFQLFSDYLNRTMDTYTKFLNQTTAPHTAKEWGGAVVDQMGPFGWIAHKLGLFNHDGVKLTPEAARRAAALAGGRISSGTVSGGGSGGGTGGGAGGLGALETQFGLPAGMLSNLYKMESGNGKNLYSPKGAVGPFQFLPSTGKDWGMNSEADLLDFGKSSKGAGGYMQSLLKKYGGNVDMALAAYNWGQGNLDKYGMGSLPKETQAYISQYHALDNARLSSGGGGLSVQQTNTTTIHVNGSNATETANKVAGAQTRVYADALRDGIGAVR